MFFHLYLDSYVLLVSTNGARCEGIANFFVPEYNDKFARACDRNAGDAEAQVICRQIGCNPVGAKRVDSKS